VGWAQRYARTNRDLMMAQVVAAARKPGMGLPRFELGELAVNCHHNYVALEQHYGESVFVTRKGAINAARNLRHHSRIDGREVVHRQGTWSGREL